MNVEYMQFLKQMREPEPTPPPQRQPRKKQTVPAEEQPEPAASDE